MEIEKLIDMLNGINSINITRGNIIDYIANNNDSWILALKSLLIKNTEKYISRQYLLGKLRFMERNPSIPDAFLDYQGQEIYRALKYI